MTPGVSNAGTALDRPRAFAELLRSHRRAAGLTQEKLAERAGISVRALRNLESGASQTPHRDTVALLAQALQLRDDERGTFAAAGRLRREQALALASPAPLGVPIPGANTPDGTPSQRVARPASGTITYLPEVLAGRLPLSVASQQRSNLTVPPTALLGREHELERIGALLRSEKVRMVTLTGPGGVGKTRLSLEVAAQVLDAFPDGVWSVRLSQLTDPDLVLPTIATTLHLKESSETPITEVLLAYLGEKRLLIVLDNFEHLAAAAPRIGALLAACPGVRALVTSRVALHLRAERECPISPLALPDLQHLPAQVCSLGLRAR